MNGISGPLKTADRSAMSGSQGVVVARRGRSNGETRDSGDVEKGKGRARWLV